MFVHLWNVPFFRNSFHRLTACSVRTDIAMIAIRDRRMNKTNPVVFWTPNKAPRVPNPVSKTAIPLIAIARM